MSITVTQKCDSCGSERPLNYGRNYGQTPHIESAAESRGWRQVRDDKHLCDRCIKAAVDA